jgi:uncharacterized repeat protein (TIGR03803 family)
MKLLSCNVATVFPTVLRFAIAVAATFTCLTACPASAQTLSILHQFAGGSDGELPRQGLVRGENGDLYGTTHGNPLPPPFTSTGGTVFKIDATGQLTTLYTFTGSTGENPTGGRLLRDDEGNLYGLTENGPLPFAFGKGTLYRLSPEGAISVLHVFGSGTDGSSPIGTLHRDRFGNLYGATAGGGTFGWGTAFKVSPDGNETVLHNFNIGVDGWLPGGGLVADAAGNLYGVTTFGGPSSTNLGEVYKISDSGEYTVLHAFTGPPDGSEPAGELMLDHEGNIYGTTTGGGSYGAGTLFKIAHSGQFAILHSFTGGSPNGTLIRDERGSLYGATTSGIFKMDPAGKVTNLFTFAPSVAEGPPISPLALDRAGNLYGTTAGIDSLTPTVLGMVFKLTP